MKVRRGPLGSTLLLLMDYVPFKQLADHVVQVKLVTSNNHLLESLSFGGMSSAGKSLAPPPSPSLICIRSGELIIP